MSISDIVIILLVLFIIGLTVYRKHQMVTDTITE